MEEASSKIVRKEFNGRMFYFHRTPTIEALTAEIFSDNYHILKSGLKINHGDVILDMGANEGVFTIMMSKLFPEARIISLEPVDRTYRQLLSNLSLGNFSNVTTLRNGIGGSARTESIVVDSIYSGGSSAFMTPYPGSYVNTIKLITLEDVFDMFRIKRCKLMKIDIEGMEHEALLNTSVLSKVDNIVAEIHINKRLQSDGYSVDKLSNYIQSQTNLLYYESCYMSE